MQPPLFAMLVVDSVRIVEHKQFKNSHTRSRLTCAKSKMEYMGYALDTVLTICEAIHIPIIAATNGRIFRTLS